MNMQQLRMIRQMIEQQQRNSDGLLSFKCGRMDYDPITKVVTAIKGPGKLKWFKSDEGYLKLQWISRINSQTDLDRMIFPNTATVVEVPECKDGRVFVLKMLDSKKRFFFWMQEPKDDKDKEYIEKMNKLCKGQSIGENNSTNPLLQQLGGNKNRTQGGGNRQQQLQRMLQGLGGMQGMQGVQGMPNFGGQQMMSEEDQIQMAIQASLRGNSSNNQSRNPTNNNTNNNTNTNNTGNNLLSNLLLQALNNTSQNIGNNVPNNNLLRQQYEKMQKEPDLTDLLNSSQNNEINELLDDEKTVETLGEQLPENMRSKEDIKMHLTSPQFRSALVKLNSVLNSPQMQLILSQMGLKSDEIMGVTAFLNAINNKHNSQNDNNNNNNNDNNEDKNKKDDDNNDNDDKNSSNENKDKKDNDNDTQMTDKN